MKGTWIRRSFGGTVVIFIHGVLSDAGAWRHENGTYWPELVADEFGDRLGVYAFEYRTGFFSGTYRLGDVVDDLENRLRLDGVLSSKRLVFVCHSMGGIVARRFIVRSHAALADASKEIGLFLIASPSLGAKYANWLAPIARLLKHSQADALRFSQENSWLMDLDQDFMNLKESNRLVMRGKELVEDQFIIPKLFFFNQVVEPIAGARYFGSPYKVPKSTHFTIAKVVSNDSMQHRLLVEFLGEMDCSLADKKTDAPSGPILIGFPDAVHADLVKCQLATKADNNNKRRGIQVDWPSRTRFHLSLMTSLLNEAASYERPTSVFHGESAASVAEFINRAHYAMETSDRIVTRVENRAERLIDGMLPYWTTALDNIIAQSLVNFLTICNVELLYANVAPLRDFQSLWRKYFPSDLEGWFGLSYNHQLFGEVFAIDQPLGSGRIISLSGKSLSTYFWGPCWEVLYAAKRRPGEPVKGTWFDKYLIPQNEYRLIGEQSDETFRYDETELSINKVRDQDGNEIY